MPARVNSFMPFLRDDLGLGHPERSLSSSSARSIFEQQYETRLEETQLLTAVGTRAQDLDTPALVVDLDVMDRNIHRIISYLREAAVSWRPHTKGTKVPAIAHRLIKAGAIGVTCAKLSEAEVMAAAGISNILIANQIVGPLKLKRLINLCRWADPIVAADNPENLKEMGALAEAGEVKVGILVEVNIGLNRCGVEPGQPAVDLARIVQDTDGLSFKGFMGWEGHTQLIADPVEKERAVAKSVDALTSTAARCRSAGLPVEIISCGGTGTYRQTALQAGVTEVQAGGGIFGDVFYQNAGAQTEFALTILSTVTSRPTQDRVVTDAGKKTMSGDTALPQPKGVEGVKRLRLAAEHCTIELEVPNGSLRVGDKLSFLVGYEDTTVCLHDYLYGARNGIIEVVWPILGRGKLQ
jgi:D-serine deaminase-like pyridoxal phosphate-dependent protein